MNPRAPLPAYGYTSWPAALKCAVAAAQRFGHPYRVRRVEAGGSPFWLAEPRPEPR